MCLKHWCSRSMSFGTLVQQQHNFLYSLCREISLFIKHFEFSEAKQLDGMWVIMAVSLQGCAHTAPRVPTSRLWRTSPMNNATFSQTIHLPEGAMEVGCHLYLKGREEFSWHTEALCMTSPHPPQPVLSVLSSRGYKKECRLWSQSQVASGLCHLWLE